MLSVVEEDLSKLPYGPLRVEKTANNTIIISYEDDMLASMKDRSEIRINFFYDETRSDGYCLSSSPTFWVLSKIQESGSNVAEGPDITNAGSKWSWEIQSQVFYTDIENLSYFEATYSDWDDADAFRTLADGALSVEVDTQKIEEENSKTLAIEALLEELLFVDEHDREYLTPDMDDFRILIYDIPEISVLCEYGIRRDEMGLPMAYMLNTNGKERKAGCKYIEVVSYDRESGNHIVRQKLMFDNEEDALHPYVAERQEFWYFFENYSGDCVIHYEHGENGGPNMTLTWENVANMDNYVSASQVAQSDTNNTSDNKDDNGSYNGTNATSQIISILSQAAGDYGSFKLVDYGNGTYALVDINYTYQQRVGEPPNYTWVENGFQGQSSLFGDGLGAEDMGDGVFVEVNLTLEREYRVVINKDGAIAFYGVDGGGMDFPRID